MKTFKNYGHGSAVMLRDGSVVTLTSDLFNGPPAQWIGLDRAGNTTVALDEEIVEVVNGKPQIAFVSEAEAGRAERA